jgi:hypothetical protein
MDCGIKAQYTLVYAPLLTDDEQKYVDSALSKYAAIAESRFSESVVRNKEFAT